MTLSLMNSVHGLDAGTLGNKKGTCDFLITGFLNDNIYLYF